MENLRRFARVSAGWWIVAAVGALGWGGVVWGEAPDSSELLRRKLEANRGNLVLEAGTYYLDETVEFDLKRLGAVALRAAGPVTVVMRGPGPAFRFLGSHEGTANPETFEPETWQERMPLIDGFEILGEHPAAVGVELSGTMQAVITRMAIRGARHGIHLVGRNRNVLISDCHIYENEGVGIYLDAVNLHQINIANCHVSYNREGGIVVRDGQVRNLQIGTCDIEGNMPGDETPTDAANIWIDLSGNDPESSVAEVAITGCTIQHSAARGGEARLAPGGANLRITGRAEYPVDNVTVGHNLLSDASVSVELEETRDVVLAGNTFFTPMPRDLVVRRSERVVISGNVFNPRQEWAVGGIVLEDSRHCLFTGNTVHGIRDGEAALLVDGCTGVRISDCIFTGLEQGILIRNSEGCEVVDCLLEKPRAGGEAVRREGKGRP